MSSPDTTEAAAQHARAIWLLGLLAKKMQRQPDGTAVLALPVRYVAAVEAYGPNGATPEDDAEESLLGDVIDSYSRSDAIADGGLVDVTEMAAEAGFRLPVALTRAAWVRAVEWSDDKAGLHDEDGRLWDVLNLAGRAARRPNGSNRVVFSVALIPRGRRTAEMVTLALTSGPGDDRAPVVTIMLPEED